MLGELRVARLPPFTVFAVPVLLQNRYSKACLSPWTGCDKGEERERRALPGGFRRARFFRILIKPEHSEPQERGSPFCSFFPPCCGHFRRMRGGRVLPFVSVRAILGRMVFLTVDVALGKRELGLAWLVPFPWFFQSQAFQHWCHCRYGATSPAS